MTIVAIIREHAVGERRIALTPETARKLSSKSVRVAIEHGAGLSAGFADTDYTDALVADRASVLAQADVLLCVQTPDAESLAALKPGSILIGALAPHRSDSPLPIYLQQRISAFALEKLPRTTRAQAMDILSSQAGMAGYKAVLGAQVEGFDVRPETREQIESLGGKFLDLGVSAAGEGGYARALTDEERALQQERLAEHLKQVDVIVTTAAVPGRPAPKIITEAMVAGMRRGSVIVDLAAETGGNCSLTEPGIDKDCNGVLVAGPLNLASMGAVHASEMYARNLLNFLTLMIVEDGTLKIPFEDELVAKTCIAHDGAEPVQGV